MQIALVKSGYQILLLRRGGPKCPSQICTNEPQSSPFLALTSGTSFRRFVIPGRRRRTRASRTPNQNLPSEGEEDGIATLRRCRFPLPCFLKLFVKPRYRKLSVATFDARYRYCSGAELLFPFFVFFHNFLGSVQRAFHRDRLPSPGSLSRKCVAGSDKSPPAAMCKSERQRCEESDFGHSYLTYRSLSYRKDYSRERDPVNQVIAALLCILRPGLKHDPERIR